MGLCHMGHRRKRAASQAGAETKISKIVQTRPITSLLLVAKLLKRLVRTGTFRPSSSIHPSLHSIKSTQSWSPPQTEACEQNFSLGSVPTEPIPPSTRPQAVRGKPIQYRPGQSNDLLLDSPPFSHSSHSIHRQIVLVPPSEYIQDTTTLIPTASIPAHSSVTSPRPAHARQCSLSAPSPAVSFQLKLDHVL